MDDQDRTESPSQHPGEPGTEATVPLLTEPLEQSRERRPLSVTHLVAGLVFLGISALWLAQEVGVVTVRDMELLVPVLLVVVGAAGLLTGLVRAARRG